MGADRNKVRRRTRAHAHTHRVKRGQECISLDHLEGVLVGDLDGPSHIPRHVDHGDDGLDLLHLVPLKALQRKLVLIRWRE